MVLGNLSATCPLSKTEKATHQPPDTRPIGKIKSCSTVKKACLGQRTQTIKKDFAPATFTPFQFFSFSGNLSQKTH